MIHSAVPAAIVSSPDVEVIRAFFLQTLHDANQLAFRAFHKRGIEFDLAAAEALVEAVREKLDREGWQFVVSPEVKARDAERRSSATDAFARASALHATKKLLVAFDPHTLENIPGDFLVPLKGGGAFYGIQTRSPVVLGRVVYIAAEINESDLFAQLMELGVEIENVDRIRSQLQRYLKGLQSYRIGNVICRSDERIDAGLKLVCRTPSEFLKRYNSCHCNACEGR